MPTSLTLRSVKGSALTHNEMDTNLTNLRTTADDALAATDTLTADKAEAAALGVANTDQNMGSFTGTTIPDNVSAKVGMQSLETAVETKANASAVGVTSSAANMGTYAGTTIPDNETAKQNIQSLETAHETLVTDLAATGGAALVGIDDGSSGSLFTTVQGFLNYLLSSAGSAIVGFIQAGTGAVARTSQAKMRETVSIADFGADPGEDIVTTVGTALTALGTTDNATLVFPKGSYTIGQNVDWSAYRNVTFVLEPGCTFSHSTFNILFPERVEVGLGVLFTGSGTVRCVNKDAASTTPSPGDGYVQYGNRSFGSLASFENATSAVSNIALGDNALASVTAGCGEIAIGPDALKSTTGNNTVPVGTSGREGWYNIAIGLTAGRDNTLGFENVYIGAFTGQKGTTAQWNTAVGSHSQITNTVGQENTSLGAYSLVVNQGDNNVAVGWAALENQTSGSNVAVGHTAMNANTTGTNNVIVGNGAMPASTTASQNVVVGAAALPNLGTGSNNTAIGYLSLGTLAGAGTNNTSVGANSLLIATGDSNTALGSGAGNAVTTETNTTQIGLAANCIASNQVTLGNASVTSLRCAVTTITAISDARHKKNIAPLDIPDEFLDEVEIVTFNWLSEEMTTDTQVGVIAQQLDELQTRYGLEWLGLVDKTVPDRWEATPGKLLFPLIVRSQRQGAMLADLAARVEALEA